MEHAARRPEASGNERQTMSLRGARAIGWSALALIPAILFLDAIVLPDDASRLLPSHGVTVGVIALLQIVLLTPLGRRLPLLVGMMVPVALGVDAITTTLLAGRAATPSYAGMILAVLAASILLPCSLWWAAGISMLLVGGHVAATVAAGEVVRITSMPTSTAVLAGTAVCVVGCTIVGARRSQRRLAAGAEARRQAVVAELREFALTTEDRRALTDRATALLAQTLDVECTALFEVATDGRLLLHAGTGWRPGTVGVTTLDAGAHTFARHVIDAGDQPVVIVDLARDHRFAVPHQLADSGLVSGAAVAVAGGGRVFGVLAAFSKRRWVCTPRERDVVKATADILVIAIARLEAERTRAGAARNATALARVGRELTSWVATPVLLERLSRVTAEVLGADHSDTWLPEPEEQVYLSVCSHGFSPDVRDRIRALRIPLQSITPLLIRVDREEAVQVTPGTHEHPFVEEMLGQFGVTRTLFVPLRRGDDIFGMQTAGFSGRTEPFTAEQAQLAVAIAQLASLALTNADLVEALEEANRLKSEFVSTMSHELRTPLNVMIGYLDMLADQPASDEHGAILARVRGSGVELLDMIESTLNLNRIQAGQDIPAFAEFRLDDLWEELRGEFAVHPRKTAAALRWQALEGVILYSDRRRLKTILKNLVGNALKFTSAGEVVVRCEQQQDACVLTVSDTGIGIPATELSVIFDMFRQVDSSESRSYSGAGLGLYIVKRLLDQLGGDVEVESTPGVGSTFRVSLPMEPMACKSGREAIEQHSSRPAVTAPAPVERADVPSRLSGQGDADPRASAGDGRGAGMRGTVRLGAWNARAPREQRKQRILYADDLEVNREVMRRLIARQFPDVEVYEACDGLQALALFEAHQPDLVLLDLRMPTMDGWMAARRIRALAGGRDVPILAVTVTASPGAEAYALHAGCNEFIPKPISDYGVLLGRIEHWLGRTRAPEAAPSEVNESVRSAARGGARRPPSTPDNALCVLCGQSLPASASPSAYEKRRPFTANPLPRT